MSNEKMKSSAAPAAASKTQPTRPAAKQRKEGEPDSFVALIYRERARRAAGRK